MALYSGSVYNNYPANFGIVQYVNLDIINNSYKIYNLNSYFSASIFSKNLSSISSSNFLFAFNEKQTVNIENINGQIFNQTIYYQRIYSSGLNNWSYYKTIGSVEQNPNHNNTIPPYSGSIICHEIIGKI
jgi:hypothetical protein